MNPKQKKRFKRYCDRPVKPILSYETKRTENESLDFNEQMTAFELVNRKASSCQFLWEPFLPAKGLAFLTGGSDCNKSTLLRQLAADIVFQKGTFLGFPLNVKFGNVIMVSTEDDQENTMMLLKKTFGEEPINSALKNWKFIFSTDDINRKIENAIKLQPVDLVIIDTWTDLYQGDLNMSNKVRANLNPLKALARKYGFALICLHHTTKRAEERDPSKNNMLGSQGIEASSRLVIELRRIENQPMKRGLTILKGNYTPDEWKNKTFQLEFNPSNMTLQMTSKDHFQNVSHSLKTEKRRLVEIRLTELRKQGLSFNSTREILVKEFGESHVPKITQLKEIAKIVGGRSDRLQQTESTEYKSSSEFVAHK